MHNPIYDSISDKLDDLLEGKIGDKPSGPFLSCPEQYLAGLEIKWFGYVLFVNGDYMRSHWRITPTDAPQRVGHYYKSHQPISHNIIIYAKRPVNRLIQTWITISNLCTRYIYRQKIFRI